MDEILAVWKENPSVDVLVAAMVLEMVAMSADERVEKLEYELDIQKAAK